MMFCCLLFDFFLGLASIFFVELRVGPVKMNQQQQQQQQKVVTLFKEEKKDI
jgi:hypothetical protein